MYTATNSTLNHSEKDESRRHAELASLIVGALKTPNRPLPNETATFPGIHIAANAVYMPVAEALTASENLLKEYTRLDDMIKDLRDEHRDPLGESWNQDIEEVDRKLRMGARVALRRVGKVLGVDKVDEDGDEVMEEGEDSELVEGMEESYELQKSLRYVERGVRRMVKGLKDEEEEE
jgi:hypothetical protein